MGIFQAKGNGDLSKPTFTRLGSWGGVVVACCLISFPVTGHKQSPLKRDVVTQLAPAGVSPPAFLGFVAFVQAELASSYAPLGVSRAGYLSASLAHPTGLPVGLLGHPAEPEPAAEGFVLLGRGGPTAAALSLAPSPRPRLQQPHAGGCPRVAANLCCEDSLQGREKAEQTNWCHFLV